MKKERAIGFQLLENSKLKNQYGKYMQKSICKICRKRRNYHYFLALWSYKILSQTKEKMLLNMNKMNSEMLIFLTCTPAQQFGSKQMHKPINYLDILFHLLCQHCCIFSKLYLHQSSIYAEIKHQIQNITAGKWFCLLIS